MNTEHTINYLETILDLHASYVLPMLGASCNQLKMDNFCTVEHLLLILLQPDGERVNSDEEFHDTTQDLDGSSEENGIDRERISDNLVDFMGTLVPGSFSLICSFGGQLVQFLEIINLVTVVFVWLTVVDNHFDCNSVKCGRLV